MRGLHNAACVRFFLRQIAPRTVIRRWKVVDRSQDMLVMEHELFRHIEIELFVTRSKLADAMTFAEELIRHFDGDRSALSPETRRRLENAGLLRDLDAQCGCYTHHYMICVRRILPDDTLISMASGGEEPWYSISFVSYAAPDRRQGFFAFADALCRAMILLFAARPHWGKYIPPSTTSIHELYPHWPRFRAMCEATDPQGAFRNRWLDGVFE